MAKKRKNKKRKRKLRIFRLILVLFILLIILFLCYMLTKIKTRGYYIYGNSYYNDEEILELYKLDNNSSYLITSSALLNKKSKKNNLIKKVKVRKTPHLELKIYVEENKMMFYDLNKKKTILEDGSEVDLINIDVPVLTNSIDNKEIYEKLYKKLLKVNDDIFLIISEIKYDPNDVDNERFLFSMNDGNYVYITLSKISKINNYEKIIESIKDKNGILYLDYGNYFVPKE